MSELLIGCGNHRQKVLKLPDGPDTWRDLVTLDIDPNCGADIEWDLGRLLHEPLPGESRFDEIHAYHVLEQTGQQGDYRWFFAKSADFWLLLKLGGNLLGIVPAPEAEWVGV